MAKTIVGYVRDNPGGVGLAGKTVTLKDAGTGLAVATGGEVGLVTNPATSDANGKFSFAMDLNPGPVYVEADLGGGNKRVRFGAEVMQADSVFLGELDMHFRMVQDGVVKGLASEFVTTASGVDRTITVQPGYANIRGNLFGWDTGNKTETGSAYGGAGTRYDYLVLRQYIAGASIGKQQVLIIEGGNATDPVVTSSEADLALYIRGTNIYDLPIKRVKTASGASTVSLDDLVGTSISPYAAPYLHPATTKSLLDLEIGVDLQAYSTILAAIAAGGANWIVDWVVLDQLSQSSASPDASTTSTTTFAVALTKEVALPAGTWSVLLVGSAAFYGTPVSGVDMRVSIEGDPGNTLTGVLDTSAAHRQRFVATTLKTALAGGGNITVEVNYRAASAGTVNAAHPFVLVGALRTS